MSLVEVMVAMVLLMVGMLGVVSQWPMGTTLLIASEFQTEASVLAEQHLEALNAAPFPPSSGSRVTGRYTLTWTISAGPIAETRRAVVTVRWNWQGRPYSIAMSTVIAAEL
jgi:Tfp pilus assembly protein PilV